MKRKIVWVIILLVIILGIAIGLVFNYIFSENEDYISKFSFASFKMQSRISVSSWFSFWITFISIAISSIVGFLTLRLTKRIQAVSEIQTIRHNKAFFIAKEVAIFSSNDSIRDIDIGVDYRIVIKFPEQLACLDRLMIENIELQDKYRLSRPPKNASFFAKVRAIWAIASEEVLREIKKNNPESLADKPSEDTDSLSELKEASEQIEVNKEPIGSKDDLQEKEDEKINPAEHVNNSAESSDAIEEILQEIEKNNSKSLPDKPSEDADPLSGLKEASEQIKGNKINLAEHGNDSAKSSNDTEEVLREIEKNNPKSLPDKPSEDENSLIELKEVCGQIKGNKEIVDSKDDLQEKEGEKTNLAEYANNYAERSDATKAGAQENQHDSENRPKLTE